MKDCIICCLPLHKKGKRRPVKCSNCNDIACLACNRRYLIECDTDSHCMFCKTGWTFNFLANNFPLCFIHKELKEHKKEKLFSEERSLLPATQTYVEAEKRKRNSEEFTKVYFDRNREIIKVIYNLQKEKSILYVGQFSETDEMRFRKINKPDNISVKFVNYRCKVCFNIIEGRGESNIFSHLVLFGYQKCYSSLFDKSKFNENKVITKRNKSKITEINDKIKKLKEKVYINDLEIWKIRSGNDQKEEDIEKTRQKSFIMPCIVSGCRGYLSTGYKCPLCKIKVCSKCHKKKEKNHVCIEDDVKSVVSIRKETKPCPNCGSRIHKINGCNNMFCTNCGTPFNWRTGLISSRQNIDNPHTAEWLRNHGNTTIEPCLFLSLDLDNKTIEYIFLRKAFNNANHISEYYISDILRAVHPTEVNLDNRIEYLIGDINETEFKKKIIINGIKEEKKRELKLIYTTYCNVVKSLAKQCEGEEHLSFIRKKIEEIKEMINYTNQSLREVSYYRKCKVDIIDLNQDHPGIKRIRITKKTDI